MASPTVWFLLLLLNACHCLRPTPQSTINQLFKVPLTIGSYNHQLVRGLVIPRTVCTLYARKIDGKDNLGDPIYEDEVEKQEGINVLGKKIAVDPLTLSLLIFGIIAFNFFVLANL